MCHKNTSCSIILFIHGGDNGIVVVLCIDDILLLFYWCSIQHSYLLLFNSFVCNIFRFFFILYLQLLWFFFSCSFQFLFVGYFQFFCFQSFIFNHYHVLIKGTSTKHHMPQKSHTHILLCYCTSGILFRFRLAPSLKTVAAKTCNIKLFSLCI